MKYKKKKEDTMSSIAIGGIVATNVVGSIPSATGDAGIRTGFSTGMGNVGKTLPTMAKIKGTRMVLKPTFELKKTFKKFTFKGARRL